MVGLCSSLQLLSWKVPLSSRVYLWWAHWAVSFISFSASDLHWQSFPETPDWWTSPLINWGVQAGKRCPSKRSSLTEQRRRKCTVLDTLALCRTGSLFYGMYFFVCWCYIIILTVELTAQCACHTAVQWHQTLYLEGQLNSALLIRSRNWR